jgi:hypothetical protein
VDGFGKLDSAAHRHGTLRSIDNMCPTVLIRTLAKSTYFKRVSLEIELIQNEAFVTIKLQQTKCPVKLLIDSGAQLSLVSVNNLKADANINKQNITQLTSATGHSARTIATLNESFYLNEVKISHEFHVYDANNLPISADGLLGMDFLVKFLCCFDIFSVSLGIYIPTHSADIRGDEIQHSACKTSTNSINIASMNDFENECYFDVIQYYPRKKKNAMAKNKYFDFPYKCFEQQMNAMPVFSNTRLCSYIHRLFNDFENETTIVPERSISYVQLKTDLHNGDYVINSCNILPNVYLFDVFITVKDNLTYIVVSNQNDFPIRIQNTDFSTLTFINSNKFQIFEMKESAPTNRGEHIEKTLKLDHCDGIIRHNIVSLCKAFSDCFFIEGDTITHTNITNHSIQLKSDAKPVFIKQYRLPEAHRKEINLKIDNLEKLGIVEKCKATGWNSPILLVPKCNENGENTENRLVADFRGVNEATVATQFPIPHIDAIIDRLANNKFFSTLDLHGAFYQIKLDEKSRNYTTFENNSFTYRFISMPQGLKTSPAAMQNAVNLMFKDFLNKGINIYLDDIIVYSQTLDEHFSLLRSVFSLLRKHNFKLKIEKCKFLLKKIVYLGYIIDEHGCLPNPKKIECIKAFPVPINVTQLQRYLGMCNYYRKFIKSYAKIAQPLYVLLRKESAFIWSISCDEAFNKLKAAMCTPPVLIFPDFKQTFIITTDASSTAVGGVLSQGALPNDRPIQFISKVLNKAEQNYSTIERELYAIVYCVDSFRHYVYGFEFVIYTDHRPLVYLFNLKKPSSKLFRWKLMLSEYSFKIIYKPGAQNVVADALSRVNYEPVDLNKILSKPDDAMIMAMTRSKIKLAVDAISNQCPQDISERKKHHNFYEIEENNDICVNFDNTDQNFYFFSSPDCEMKRKMEYRSKTNINVPKDITPLIPFSLNDKQTILFFPNENRSDKRIMNIKLALETILQLCTDKNYNVIAVNIDYKQVSLYFEFKYLFKEIFINSAIKTKFYLNKIIEVCDLDQILDILSTYHNSSLAGHASFEKTKNSIKRYYRWPTMNKDIKQFISNCEICKKAKISRHTKSPMQITSTSDYPFQKVYIDFVNVERTHTNIYPCIFTCIDELTKYGIAVRAKNCTALLAAKKFVKEVILKYNIPDAVVSDLGAAFTSDVFKEITKLFKIKKISTTPYRPNANIVERFHRTLAQHLITCVHENPNSWHEHLDSAVFAYNNTVNSSTGYSPHELLFGYKIKLPDKIIKNFNPVYNYGNYRDDLRLSLAKYWKIAQENIDVRKQKNKEYRDINSNTLSLKVGDKVFMRKPFKEHKYSTPYEGPFIVEEILSPVTIKIKKGHKSIKIHADKLKMA